MTTLDRSRLPALLTPACVLAALACFAAPAVAFPPYRSTDADTAGAGMAELRLGLIRAQHRDSRTARTAPLLRANLGIGTHYEVITELEHSRDEHRLDEGALGFKWARLTDGRGIGVETLVLLPVQPRQGGAGLESQLLGTVQRERWQLHLNAGGIYDPRGPETARGWRASILAEFPRERLRPGLELFARDTNLGESRVQVGAGVIADLALFELRTGLHFGLSDAAPDVEASVWLAWKWRVASAR